MQRSLNNPYEDPNQIVFASSFNLRPCASRKHKAVRNNYRRIKSAGWQKSLK